MKIRILTVLVLSIFSHFLSAQSLSKVVLAKGVTNMEPVGETLKFEKEDRAYCWMKVEGATPGSKIFVEWYFGDAIQHTSTLNIKYASTRTYTYKTLYTVGAWRVLVKTENGRVLSEIKFSAGTDEDGEVIISNSSNSMGTNTAPSNQVVKKVEVTGEIIEDGTFTVPEVYILNSCDESSWLYITPNGKVLGYSDENREASEGMIILSEWDPDRSAKKHYQLVSSDGEYRSEWYHDATPFMNGLAAVSSENNVYNFIDKTGKTAINETYLDAKEFSGGLAPVKDSKTRKWMYIDTKGKVEISPQFSDADPFEGSTALVEMSGKSGVIDRKGNLIVPARFLNIFRKGPYFYAEERKDGDFIRYVFNPEGKQVAGPVTTAPEANGKVFVLPTSLRRNLFHLYNEQGEKLAEFTRFKNSSEEGMIIIRLDDRWKGYDENGKVRFEIDADDLENFHDGLAVVKKANQYGIIDKDGQLLISYQSKRLHPEPSKNGIRFYQGNKMGMFSTDGRVIMEPRYAYISLPNEGVISAYETEYRGSYREHMYYDTSGNKLFKPQYQLATNFEKGLARVGKPLADATLLGMEECAYINKKGDVFWMPEEETLGESRVVLPPDYDSSKKYPVVIFMPFTYGTGMGHFKNYVNVQGDDLQQGFADFLTDVFPSKKAFKENAFIALIPDGTGSPAHHSAEGFSKLIEKYDANLKQEIERHSKDINIDADRIYFSGYSLGGDLSWALTNKNPTMYKGAILAGTRCGYPPRDSMPVLKKNDVRFFLGMGEYEETVRIKGMNYAKSILDKNDIANQYFSIPKSGHVMVPAKEYKEALRFVLEEK